MKSLDVAAIAAIDLTALFAPTLDPASHLVMLDPKPIKHGEPFAKRWEGRARRAERRARLAFKHSAIEG